MSASVCGLETCTMAVREKKKKKKVSFLNYVANLIHTVCMCICVPQFGGNGMGIVPEMKRVG